MCKEWCMWVLLKLRKTTRGEEKPHFEKMAFKDLFVKLHTVFGEICINQAVSDISTNPFVTNHRIYIRRSVQRMVYVDTTEEERKYLKWKQNLIFE